MAQVALRPSSVPELAAPPPPAAAMAAPPPAMAKAAGLGATSASGSLIKSFAAAGPASSSSDPDVLPHSAEDGEEEPEAPDDLSTLPVLSEAAIVSAIEARFRRQQAYTRCGEMLIALNPFRDLPLYSPAAARRYDIHDGGGPGLELRRGPHIFAVAQLSYQLLVRERQDQVCLISGESGAGKTETSKYFLQQLLVGGQRDGLAQRIFDTNPLLEAFGNAQTALNVNSSRFGKYLEVLWDDKAEIVGARLSHYLLEQSRVVRHGPNESNFHIFYYLIAGMPESAKQLYGLRTTFFYNYLCPSGGRVSEVALQGQRPSLRVLAGRQDAEMYQKVCDGLTAIGFSTMDLVAMHVVLIGILLVGNIDFGTATDLDSAEIPDMDPPERFADLMGLDLAAVVDVLTKTTIATAGETFKRSKTRTEAIDCRDAIATALYSRLFAWIVGKVNCLLNASAASQHAISVLDIFGFENLRVNSLEQLLINVANEKLQSFFNEAIFAWERADHEAEGVPFPRVAVETNEDSLELLLGQPLGLLNLLAEECRIARATDTSFLQKLAKFAGAHPCFVRSKVARRHRFSVRHFAGVVQYDARNFLAKNRDNLGATSVALLQGSSCELVRDLFGPDAADPPAASRRTRHGASSRRKRESPAASLRPLAAGLRLGSRARSSWKRQSSSRRSGSSTPGSATGSRRRHQRTKSQAMGLHTITARFQVSLRSLMRKIAAATPHFVRCIKPNAEMSPRVFATPFVTRQLKCAGVMEAVRIRKHGYAAHLPFAAFAQRFALLAYPCASPVGGSLAACQQLLDKLCLDADTTQLGRTKVFLKVEAVAELERHLEVLHARATLLAAVARGMAARREHGRRHRAEAERRRAEEARRAEDARVRGRVRELQVAAKQSQAELLRTSRPWRSYAEENISSHIHARVEHICGRADVAAFEVLDDGLGDATEAFGTEDLNRYTNIVPRPETAVTLAAPAAVPPWDSEEGALRPEELERRLHYINANWVRDHEGSPRAFIATQGPLEATAPGFWQMVWEQGAAAIVMLTSLTERGVAKCHPYWPKKLYNHAQDVGHVRYGDVTVYVLGGVKQHQHVVSDLVLRRGAETRTCRHFWFLGWPDYGVPAHCTGVLTLRMALRSFLSTRTGPAIVHCSAGIGRTGTFLAVDTGIELARRGQAISTLDLVAALRADRGGMVQSEEQFVFIRQCLVEYATVAIVNGMLAADDSPENADENAVLIQSIAKASTMVPPGHVHPSQRVTDEGAEDKIPAWRQQQKNAKAIAAQFRGNYRQMHRHMLRTELLRTERTETERRIEEIEREAAAIATGPPAKSLMPQPPSPHKELFPIATIVEADDGTPPPSPKPSPALEKPPPPPSLLEPPVVPLRARKGREQSKPMQLALVKAIDQFIDRIGEEEVLQGFADEEATSNPVDRDKSDASDDSEEPTSPTAPWTPLTPDGPGGEAFDFSGRRLNLATTSRRAKQQLFLGGWQAHLAEAGSAEPAAWATISYLEEGFCMSSFDARGAMALVQAQKSPPASSAFSLGRIASSRFRRRLGRGLRLERDEHGDVWVTSRCRRSLHSLDGLGKLQPARRMRLFWVSEMRDLVSVAVEEGKTSLRDLVAAAVHRFRFRYEDDEGEINQADELVVTYNAAVQEIFRYVNQHIRPCTEEELVQALPPRPEELRRSQLALDDPGKKRAHSLIKLFPSRRRRSSMSGV